MTTVKSQEASSSKSPCSYHVFLSFRGEDTRKTFTDHLYSALMREKFHTFRDDDGIERGEDIKSELQKAIQESRISIVVFSKNYAFSSWCLDELVMILNRKRTTKHMVLPVFYDVDPSQVRKQLGCFEEAFSMHEERFEAETVKGWREALREVANLAGMNLPNQADGYESKLIQKIIQVIGDKLSRTVLDIAPYPIGIHSRSKNIQLWLEDESTKVGIAAICGMGGIGKTTIAAYLYNLNFSRFEGSSFLENVREIAKQQDGLICLQRQLLSDILHGREVKISSVREGTIKIRDSICGKKVLIVLDDVEEQDQLHAVLGMRDWIFPGSKIVITTRREGLLKDVEVCKVYRLEKLDSKESLKLFSLHAFGQNHPIDDYMEDSKKVVNHCGGLPLAIKILGSSLSGKPLNIWKSQLEKLKAIPDSEIFEKLRLSYDSLDDFDKDLFLHVACFFVGKDKDITVTILEGCKLFATVGIPNLIDRCLLTVDKSNKLAMHQLLQDMGKEIIRRESPKEPGERSRLWDCEDSINVLKENVGTRKIEGLIVDMCLLKKDESPLDVVGVNRKRRFEEVSNQTSLSNVWNSVKRYRFGIFNCQSLGTAPRISNTVVLESDAFSRMDKLKLLQLYDVHMSGSYENFPKEVRWLCWHGCHFKSIPSDFPLENVVVLDMRYSSLINVFAGTKFLKVLKILDLSHSHNLANTPNFSKLPNLERLILKDCTRLFEVHESIGYLERLVLINLKDCKNMRKLPRSMAMLKSLETLDISGCSNLEESTEQSLKAWHSFMPPWLLKLRKTPEISWAAALPRSLTRLRLGNCNLSEDAFPRDLSNLSSLKFLDLSCNPIRSLPDFIRGLTGLQLLDIVSCPRLESLIGMVRIKRLFITDNPLLEKITFLSNPLGSTILNTCIGDYSSLVEIMGLFKLEPIEEVDVEIVNNLGLSNLRSPGIPTVQLYSNITRTLFRKLPLQGCHEKHIFCVYLPGSKVPPCFSFTNIGSSISFAVPSLLNFRIQGLCVCSVYEIFNQNHHAYNYCEPHTIISNTTKSLVWSHGPTVYGIPEADENMIWLSYWKFENQLEVGDELNVSVVGRNGFQVKEVGVRIVYKEQEKSIQIRSTSEAAAAQQIILYGNIVPGTVSACPAGLNFYCLGNHYENCTNCPPPLRQPPLRQRWTPDPNFTICTRTNFQPFLIS